MVNTGYKSLQVTWEVVYTLINYPLAMPHSIDTWYRWPRDIGQPIFISEP